MVDTTTPIERRSSRIRAVQATRLANASSSPEEVLSDDNEDEDMNGEVDHDAEHDDQEEAEGGDDGDDFVGPGNKKMKQKKTNSGRAQKVITTKNTGKNGRSVGASAGAEASTNTTNIRSGSARNGNVNANTPAVAKKSKTGGGRKTGNVAVAGGEGPATVARVREAVEVEIRDDNGLFNALLSPDLALDSVLEDWVDAFNQTGQGRDGEEQERQYLSELIIFILRCSGLNFEIEPEQSDDLDGIPDALDDIHNKLAEDDLPRIYPLISKDKKYKSFAKNLTSFISTFVNHLSSTPLLYVTPNSVPPSSGPTTPIIHLLLSWLNPMTASQYRAIRHTSTFVVLKLGSALCDIAQQVKDDAKAAKKQLDIETKRGKKGGKVLAGLEAQVKDFSMKEVIMDEYMDDVFNGVFVHRYRDKDPLIRIDCLRELGQFMIKYPSKFVDTAHLHYVDWALTDSDSHARLEAIKSIVPLYNTDAHLRSMRIFTTRAVPRIVEMAARDIDLKIRIQAVNVLCQLENLGKLEEENPEKRNNVACLIYDKEPRIRKAISNLIKSLLETKNAELDAELSNSPQKQQKKNQNRRGISEDQASDEQEDTYTALKAIASVLLSISKRLDVMSEKDKENVVVEPTAGRHVLSSMASVIDRADSRAKIAVDALYAEIPTLQDWSTFLDYLTVDHSKAKDDSIWALDEEEETFMLEVANAALEKAVEDKEIVPEVTRSLTEVIPKLFSRHQSDANRMAEVLRLASKCDFASLQELSLEQSSMWDHVTRQFLRQSDPEVLRGLLVVIRALHSSANEELANEKIQELKDGMATNLREVLAGKEIEQANFDDIELQSTESALLRFQAMIPFYDMREVLDVKGSAKDRNNLWDVVLALAERGKLGWKEEDRIASYAMQILVWNLTWNAVAGRAGQITAEEELAQIESRRDEVVQFFKDVAFGDNMTPTEVVRREGITGILKLFNVFAPEAKPVNPFRTRMAIEMEDAVQFRLAGSLQAAIDKQADVAAGIRKGKRTSSVDSNGSAMDEEDEVDEPLLTTINMATDAEFYNLIWHFVASIKAGVIEAQHSAVLLNNYGTIDSAFDATVPMIVDALANEAIHNDDSQLVVDVFNTALQTCFENSMDSTAVAAPKLPVALAKEIAPAFFTWKSGFKTEPRIQGSTALLDLHRDSVKWAVDKIAQALKNEKSQNNKKGKMVMRERAVGYLEYFKVLNVFAPGLKGREALTAKKHLTDLLEAKGVQPAKTKSWEPLAVYERKLVSLASGDNKVQAASKKAVAAAPQEQEQEEEDEIAVAQRRPLLRARSPVLSLETVTQQIARSSSSPRKRFAEDEELEVDESAVDDDLPPLDIDNSLELPILGHDDLLPMDDGGLELDLSMDTDGRSSRASSVMSYGKIRAKKKIRRD